MLLKRTKKTRVITLRIHLDEADAFAYEALIEQAKVLGYEFDLEAEMASHVRRLISRGQRDINSSR